MTTVSGDPVLLLKQLIQCASITPQTAGVLDVLEATLVPLGFAVTRLAFQSAGAYQVDNLFATRGTGAPHLLFAGHTDVVPPGEVSDWSHPPFAAVEENGEIFGRGAVDMKGGIAAFVSALADTIGRGKAESGTISLVITNDEEADGIDGTDKVMAWAAAQGHRFDFAVVGEPGSRARVGDSLKIGRRGSLNGRVSITGTQGHVAYPERANNPLPVLGALISELSGHGLDAGTAHFPPSNLEVTSADVGNGTTNLIPARAKLSFNIRFNDLWTPESLADWLAERLASVDQRGCALALEIPGRPSRAFLSPTTGTVAKLIGLIEAHIGQAPELSTGGGTSDARFIAPYCPVIELGLVGATMHQVDERVPIADLVALAGLYGALMEAFLNG